MSNDEFTDHGAQKTGMTMTDEPYDYSVIARHPRLISFYTGWLGQKAHALAYLAVLRDRHDLWSTAAGEVDRLVLIMHEAAKLKHVDLSGETGAALGEMVGRFADGGWWTSAQGVRERAAHHRERLELDEFPDHESKSPDDPFEPRLLLDRTAVYAVAAPTIGALDTALTRIASTLQALDVSRLGTLLSGFCHRLTPKLHVRLINSVLGDLAGRDMVDLQSENELRRALNLVEVDADRRPVALSALKFYPPRCPPMPMLGARVKAV